MAEMTDDMENLREWIGRTDEAESRITAPNADILNATFDRDDPPLKDGDAIPPAWHWLYFPEHVKLADTGPDGHAARGGFMPPVPLPRRMWATNRQRYHRPLRVGEAIRKVSTITDVAPKTGRSGALCFVTTRHEIFGADGLATTEDHTTVYRGAADPNAPAPQPQPAPGTAVWKRAIHPTPVLLFRYSAVTMNSHRIHYDRDYVKANGYPGLLVQGTLIARLMLELVHGHRPDADIAAFAFRSGRPLYDTGPFTIEGEPSDDGAGVRLRALGPDGGISMTAAAEIRGER